MEARDASLAAETACGVGKRRGGERAGRGVQWARGQASELELGVPGRRGTESLPAGGP